MRLLSSLLSSLALPVIVRGFAAFTMPPSVNSVNTMLLTPKSVSVQTRKRAIASVTPLRYTEDPNAVHAESVNSAITGILPRGGAASGRVLRHASKLPLLAATAAAITVMTKWLSGVETPAAQGLKLVYAGAIAGIVSRTFCAPIEMVSTVMMCRGDECTSMISELARTWRREGFRGMFKGNGANCLKVAPSRGTQFLVYEFVKRKMLLAGVGLAVGASAGTLHAGARLFAGGIAGMVAALIVYPLEVVKTMLTLYPDRCGGSIPGALSLVFEGSGVSGLYRGLGPTLIAMFPYVGVEFMVYETLKKRWEMYIGPVGTATLLLLGAAGGAAAQASAHPLDVIRRRMQMQSMNADKNDDNEEREAKKVYSNMFSGLYHVGKTEGVHVLFNGLGPACLEKIPSTAIGYFIYEFLKGTLKVSSV